MPFAYYLTTPGVDPESSIQLVFNGVTVKRSYLKFGDMVSKGPDKHAEIRGAYGTHNPDYSVFAVMPDGLPAAPVERLGTKIKNHIEAADYFDKTIFKVAIREWFYSEHIKALNLSAMLSQNWDRRTVDTAKLQSLLNAINKILK